MAFDRHQIAIGSKITLRLKDCVPPAGQEARPDGTLLLETTLGRALFNEALPADYPFVDTEVGSKRLGTIVNDLAERYPKVEVAVTLDKLKDLGFHWATRSGVTVSISDVQTPPTKKLILAGYEAKAVKVDKLYERGQVTEEERRQELDPDLDGRDRRADRRHGGQLHPREPHLHDGSLGRTREHDPDASDRGHARPGGEPQGRDHPDPDQVELP